MHRSVTSVQLVRFSNVTVIVISALQCRIGGVEGEGFNDPVRRHQLHEPYIDPVLKVGRLAAQGEFAGRAVARRIEQRHSIAAAHARVECVDVAGHLGRWEAGREDVGSLKAA